GRDRHRVLRQRSDHHQVPGAGPHVAPSLDLASVPCGALRNGAIADQEPDRAARGPHDPGTIERIRERRPDRELEIDSMQRPRHRERMKAPRLTPALVAPVVDYARLPEARA